MCTSITNAQALISRLEENNIHFVKYEKNQQDLDALYVYGTITNEKAPILSEIVIQKDL